MLKPLGRRSLLKAGLAGAVLAAPQARLLAGASSGGRLDALMARSIAINGNMLPAFNEDPSAPDFQQEVLSTGLTAVRYSLAGAEPSFEGAIDHIGWVNKQIAAHGEVYLHVRSTEDIRKAKELGRIGIIYAFEDATMFDGRLDRIELFCEMGVRSMQLSYNGQSPFASGVMVPDRDAGLTEKGRHAVILMNALGVTVDASHSNDRSTLDIVEQSDRPIMISHAGCGAVFDHPRNRSDAALRAVAEAGGVVGIYELAYLTPGLEQQTLDVYMRHLTHAIDVCGEDHVGIGSDALLLEFDTGPESMKQWNDSIAERKKAGVNAPGEGPPPFVVELNGPQRMRLIAGALLDRGYSERAVEKILGANFLRVFEETWR
ncbi:dipeptidase [Altererythrobacter sp.]|uniref:dipeptidase n=1 Tax=Altererythrobacter sp. TaxID=1872480 RepID=UPI003D06FFC4